MARGQVARLRRVALPLAGIVVSILAIYLLTRFVDIGSTAELLARTSPGPIVAAAGLLVLQLVLRSVRWSYLLPVDGPRVPPQRLVAPLLIGYLGNVLLPARLGEPVRAYLVSRRERVALSGALGSVVLERVIDLATVALVAWLAAVVARAPDWIVIGTGVVALGGLAITGVLVFIGVGRVASWVQRVIAPRSSAAVRIRDVLLRFGEGAGAQPRRYIALAFAVSVSCWLLDGSVFWLVSTAFGEPLPWSACVLIATIVVVGTAIPSAPGYLGTYELAAVAAGTALGLPSDTVLAMAVLGHVLSTLLMAAGGIGVILLSPFGGQIGGAFRAAASDRRE